MNIDKVGGISPLYEPKKTSRTNSVSSSPVSGDKIEISEEYKIESLKRYIKDIAISNEIEPERLEKINQIKSKLQENYIDKLTSDEFFQIGKKILLNSKETLDTVKSNLQK